MSNLNIHQKVSLMAQKSKESKRKESNLSEAEQKKADFELAKQNLSDKEKEMLEKYLNKLSILGTHNEHDVYDLLRKYDWNEKVLGDVVQGKLKAFEDAGNFEGWSQVKRVEKPQPAKADKEYNKDQNKNKKFQKYGDNEEGGYKKPYEQRENYKPGYKKRQQEPEEERENNDEGDAQHQDRYENNYRYNNYNNNYRGYNNYNNRGGNNFYKKNRGGDQYQQRYGRGESSEQYEYVKKEKKPAEEGQEEVTTPSQINEHSTEAHKPIIHDAPIEKKSSPVKEQPQKEKNASPVKPKEVESSKPEQKKDEHHEPKSETKPSAHKSTPIKEKVDAGVPQVPAHKDNTSQQASKPTIIKQQPQPEPPKKESPVKAQETKPTTEHISPPVKHEEKPVTQSAAPQQVQPQVQGQHPQQPTGTPMMGPYMPSFGGPQPTVLDSKNFQPLFPFPYIVFPQPNGQTLIQPLFMMPPMMPPTDMSAQNEHMRFAQPQAGVPIGQHQANNTFSHRINTQSQNPNPYFAFDKSEENRKPQQNVQQTGTSLPGFQPYVLPQNMMYNPFGGVQQSQPQNIPHQQGSNAPNQYFRHH